MLLATDLDGTFLGGESLQREKLYELIKTRKDIILVFVTGRGVQSVLPLFRDAIIPKPNYIIADVGATVLTGETLEPVLPLQTTIQDKWPGNSRLLTMLQDVEGMAYQEVPQERRCSFITSNEQSVQQVTSMVKELDCDVIYSAGRFLDVLPSGVNKGRSLNELVNFLGIDKNDVMVAGDTLNDLAMYHCGFKGVVVGGAEPKLLSATKGIKDVHHASAAGAGGILEALRLFGFVCA